MAPHLAFPRLTALILLCLVGNALMAAGPVLAQEKVAYRLKWLINASTAGDVFALDQGLFSRQGLEVAVKAGGPERDAVRELELGYAQFGVASADQVIRALAKGASVVVLAQLFQVNPLQWIYRADDFTLSRIQDLAGRTVGITYGGNDETIMRALLASVDMDEHQVRLASVRYDYTPFFQNQVTIWPVYRNTQGLILSDKLAAGGERVAFFDPSEHGVRFVANSVVASQKMMDLHPQLVGRFTRALLAGWRAAMAPANESAVVRAVAQYDRDTSEAVMRRQLAATRQMIQPDPDIPIGHIDTTAWRQTEQIMIRQRLIPGPVNVIGRLTPQEELMK
jgi:NitT/TauT family transport system substrate-binding protein